MTNGMSIAEDDRRRDEKVSLRAEDANKAVQLPTIVFQSGAAYHPLICLLIAFGPLATLASIITVCADKTQSDSEKRFAVLTLLGTTLALVILLAAVLPRSFQVLSDASVSVVTIVQIQWNFPNVSSAHAYGPTTLYAEWWRPKIKFAVDLGTRVVVRRQNGAWDLLVSPKDPAGFVEAVRGVDTACETKPSENKK